MMEGGGWNFPIGSAMPTPARLVEPRSRLSNKHRPGYAPQLGATVTKKPQVSLAIFCVRRQQTRETRTRSDGCRSPQLG